MRPNDAGRLAAPLIAATVFTGFVVLSTLTTGCASRTERIEDDLVKTFAEIDADRDGKLSRAEYTNSRLGKLGAENQVNFDRLDANNDDGITAEEMDLVIAARERKPSNEQSKPKQRTK